jgi:hypothetical protein
MSLADDLENEEIYSKPQSLFCGVCKLLTTLSEKEVELLQSKMNDQLVTHMALSRILKKNGYNISDGVMGRHRRGLCVRPNG